MTTYTLGFIFNHDLSKVLLIHKLTPEWQKGKVNGLGGKFEHDEDCFKCISREVTEECSLVVAPASWLKFAVLESSKWQVDVLASVFTGQETAARSIEAEQVEWFNVNSLPATIMENLSWLIPLAKDALVHKELTVVTIRYKF